jgi:allophanate hydrolase subunit 1
MKEQAKEGANSFRRIGLAHVGAGTVLVRMETKPAPRGELDRYKMKIDSLGLPGVTDVSSWGGYLRVEFDPLLVAFEDLKSMLVAACSAARHARQEGVAPRTHKVRVTFGGSGGPDLSIASVLLGASEAALIKRLCRTPRLVKSLCSPAASPLLATSASDELPSFVLANHARSLLPAGTLTLSSSGVTISRCPWRSDELAIGSLVPDHPPNLWLFHAGDTIRLQPATSTA